jgi:hypothetical protein
MRSVQPMAVETAHASREPLTGTAAQGALTGRVVPRREVDAALEQRLFDLFQRYYQNVDRAAFHRDLVEKDWVLLLTDAANTDSANTDSANTDSANTDSANVVQGFTTIMLSEVELDGRTLRTVFSGNTVIDRAYWGRQELMETWCRFAARLKAEQPEVPLYWFLICSGYRTYLYLPLFYHEFYPRHDEPTPQFEQKLIDALGEMKFPGEYLGGIVRVARPRECLLPALAVPPVHKLANHHVRFFVERNPGYLRGDELVCVTEFSLPNLRRRARQIAAGAAPSGGE